MRWLAVISMSLFGLTWLTPQRSGGGWGWDTANAIGFAAFSLILYLQIDKGRGRGLRRHQALAWLAASLVCMHAVFFWLLDETSLEYLKPTMPLYMAAGLFALALLVAVPVASPGAARRLGNANHGGFRLQHWWLSVILIAAAGYHLLGSGFYLNTRLQGILLVLLLTGLALWPRMPYPGIAAGPVAAGAAVRRAVAVLALISIVFVLARNFQCAGS